MASLGFGFRAGRLDASEQTIVYCHGCNHEWPRSERESIVCPRCNSDVTEIVEPGSDPRDMPEYDPFTPFLNRNRFQNNNRPGSDSDPEEFDIENHVPPGAAAFLQRAGYPTLARSMEERQERLDRDRERRERERRDQARPPAGGEDIIWRFADVLHQMGSAGRPTPPDGSARESPFTTARAERSERATDDSPFMQPRIHRTTIRSGPFGGGITITSSTFGRTSPGGDPATTDFDRIFGTITGTPASPSPGERQNRPPVAAMGGFAALLQELLGAAMNPASAVHGDAVYTQEALDRIVSTLMEAHPQSNGAPPATQTAIEHLEKKKLTQEMIGSEGKAECTICIDEMHLGDEATVLPCTHWFHGECVTLWLKEHNTCPICRRPIETSSERRERRATGSRSESDPNTSGSQSQSTAGPSSTETSDAQAARARRLRTMTMNFSSWPDPDRADERTRRGGDTSPYSRGFFFMNSNSNPRTPDSPPPRIDMPGNFPSEFRDLNTDYYDRQVEQDRERERERERAREHDQATSSSSRFSFFESSGINRRDNNGGSHSRDGSRGNSEGGQGNHSSGSASGGSSHNPFSWVRNHFGSGRNSGGSGSGSSNTPENSDRERRWRS